MTCSNCGKSISYAGKICPYCKAEKKNDQQTQTLSVGIGFVAGIVAYLVTNEISQAIVWGIVGLIMGFVFSKIIAMIQRPKD